MRVRQSMHDDCLRAMQYNIEAKSFNGGSIRAVGTGYHKAHETYYNTRIESGYFEPGADQITELVEVARREFDRVSAGGTSHPTEVGRDVGTFIWNKTVPDRDTAFDILNTIVRSYYEGGWFWPQAWTPIGTEVGFNLPWYGEHTRSGSADLVLLDENDWIIIDDHKTAATRAWNKGKESARKKAQGPWYNWAMRELFPGHAGYANTFTIMKYDGTAERRLVVPTEQQIMATARRMSELVDSYVVIRANGMDMPANPESTLCSPEYCDHWSYCPYGQANDAPLAA